MTGPSLTFVRSDFTFNAETPSPKVRETLMERRDLVRYPPKSVDEELLKFVGATVFPFHQWAFLFWSPRGRVWWHRSIHVLKWNRPSACRGVTDDRRRREEA